MLPDVCCAIIDAKLAKVFQARIEEEKMEALVRFSWTWFHQVPGANKLPKPTKVEFFTHVHIFVLTWDADNSDSVTVQFNDTTSAELLHFCKGKLVRSVQYLSALGDAERLVHDLLACSAVAKLMS